MYFIRREHFFCGLLPPRRVQGRLIQRLTRRCVDRLLAAIREEQQDLSRAHAVRAPVCRMLLSLLTHPYHIQRSLRPATTTRLEYETRKVCTVVPVAKPKDGNVPCSWQSASATCTPRASPIPPFPSTLTPYTCARRGGGETACGVWGDCRFEPQPCLLPCLHCRRASSAHSPGMARGIALDQGRNRSRRSSCCGTIGQWSLRRPRECAHPQPATASSMAC